MCTDNCGGVTVFKGENGVGIISTVDNGDGTFTITYTDGTTFTSKDLTGPTGATGPTGPAGTIPGGGTNNYVARWTPDGATLGDSVMRDDGTTVGVGTAPDATRRFLSYSNTHQQSIYGLNQSTSGGGTGVYGKSDGVTTGSQNYGVQGYGSGATGASSHNIGVLGSGGTSISLPSLTDGVHIGVWGNASASSTNAIGLAAYSRTSNSSDNIGIYVNVGNTGAGNAYIGRFIDGNQGVGKVLTSDVNGYATWQAPATGGSGITWNTITGTNPTATLVANNGYVVRDTSGGGTTDLTLPSTGVVVGDIIKIIATKEGGGGALQTWRILEGRVADVIFYSFFDVFAGSESAGVKSTSPLLTFNDLVSGSYNVWKNQTVTLTCIEDLGTGYAWEIELANGKMFS